MGLIRIKAKKRVKRTTKEYIRTVYVVQWASESNYDVQPDWNEYANLPWYDDYLKAREVVLKKRDRNPNLYFEDNVLYCAVCEGWGVHVPGCVKSNIKLQ